METVRPNTLVTIRYTMKTHIPDGVRKDHPEEKLTFIFGVERQVPTLEKALEGCRTGDRRSLDIPASEIYGAHDPSLIREIPKKGLIKQRLKEGQFYRQIRKGCLVSFKVLEIRPETVLVDFNTPLVGIWISIDLEVSEIKAASEKEIHEAQEGERRKKIGCG